jgi:hypothetical protein
VSDKSPSFAADVGSTDAGLASLATMLSFIEVGDGGLGWSVEVGSTDAGLASLATTLSLVEVGRDGVRMVGWSIETIVVSDVNFPDVGASILAQREKNLFHIVRSSFHQVPLSLTLLV